MPKCYFYLTVVEWFSLFNANENVCLGGVSSLEILVEIMFSTSLKFDQIRLLTDTSMLCFACLVESSLWCNVANPLL